jgi:hypothetical protein
MAGCAGGTHEIVLPGSPVFAFQLEVLTAGMVHDAVFRFIPDFDLRVIRAQVALATGFGLASLSDAELMSGMAG